MSALGFLVPLTILVYLLPSLPNTSIIEKAATAVTAKINELTRDTNVPKEDDGGEKEINVKSTGRFLDRFINDGTTMSALIKLKGLAESVINNDGKKNPESSGTENVLNDMTNVDIVSTRNREPLADRGKQSKQNENKEKNLPVRPEFLSTDDTTTSKLENKNDVANVTYNSNANTQNIKSDGVKPNQSLNKSIETDVSSSTKKPSDTFDQNPRKNYTRRCKKLKSRHSRNSLKRLRGKDCRRIPKQETYSPRNAASNGSSEEVQRMRSDNNRDSKKSYKHLTIKKNESKEPRISNPSTDSPSGKTTEKFSEEISETSERSSSTETLGIENPNSNLHLSPTKSTILDKILSSSTTSFEVTS